MKKWLLFLLCVALLGTGAAWAEYESDSTLSDSFLKGGKNVDADGETIEVEIPMLVLPASFEGTREVLGETGMSLLIPKDWKAREASDGAIAVFGDAHSVTLTVTREKKSLEDIYQTLLQRALKENTPKETDAESEEAPEVTPHSICQLLNLNGRLFVNYTDSEGNDSAYTELDGESVLCFSFVYADNEIAKTGLPAEIIGSIENE